MMRGLFIRIAFSLLVGALSCSAHAWQPIASEQGNWPWYESTVLAGLTRPTSDRAKVMRLPVPGKTRTLAIRFWKAQATPQKGLVLILPGTGGNSSSGMSNMIAQDVSAFGYDALILTDPFSPEFQRSFSSDGLIGFPQHDIDGTERMLNAAIDFYTRRFGRPGTVDLIGSSLGGLYTVMLGGRRSTQSFRQLIAINPPVNFQYAMDRLDDMIHELISDRYSMVDLYWDMAPSYLKSENGITLKNVNRIRQALPSKELTDSEIIGERFQQTLIDVTRGLYDAPSVLADPLRRRRAESSIDTITFAKYLGYVGISLVWRGLYHGRTFSSMAEEMSLLNLLKQRESVRKIQVVTNVDDFLLQPGDLDHLEELLQDRLHVFEGGGHCGNYWSPSFRKTLGEILSH